MPPSPDPLAQRAHADAVLERACRSLEEILQGLVRALDPFPSFLGMATIQAVEVEPDVRLKGERGCIVLCPDGQFYELVLRTIPGPPEFPLGQDQVEEFRPLELSPLEYLALAHAAIGQLCRLLEERAGP